MDNGASVDLYDYLINTKESIQECIGDATSSRRVLIKFRGWFIKNKFELLSFVETNPMASRVLMMKDLRSVFINELDSFFNGMRNMSINRIDEETLEDMMDDLADFFESINLESFKSPDDYEMSANLSPNLQYLLNGLQSGQAQSSTDWVPPSAPGLQNSDRLLTQDAATERNLFLRSITSSNDADGAAQQGRS